MSRILSGRHWLTWLSLSALALSLTAVAAAARPDPLRSHRWSASWWLAGGVSDVPPPPSPALWARFIVLHQGYQSLPSPKPMGFEEWIGRHGVSDPLDVRTMVFLYRWAGASR
jgi:hypothetical protein